MIKEDFDKFNLTMDQLELIIEKEYELIEQNIVCSRNKIDATVIKFPVNLTCFRFGIDHCPFAKATASKLADQRKCLCVRWL